MLKPSGFVSSTFQKAYQIPILGKAIHFLADFTLAIYYNLKIIFG
ncbi:MAG: hypothetical protein AAB969_03875 [Patescibacteria group bacterium]